MTERRQIGISVSPKVYERIHQMAKSAGMTGTAYANLLFDAAYSARCKPTGDLDLDAAVARVVVLWGANRFDAPAIAAHVGLSETTVTRIIDGWKSEISLRAA